MVFQHRDGGDTFLVLDTETWRVHLYVVVDRLLCPSTAAVAEYEQRPYFWHDPTGMMYILKHHSARRIGRVANVDQANVVLEKLHEGLA